MPTPALVDAPPAPRCPRCGRGMGVLARAERADEATQWYCGCCGVIVADASPTRR